MTPVRCVVDTNVAITASGRNDAASAKCAAASARALQRVMSRGHVFIDAAGARGSFDIRGIACLLGPSRFVDGPAEGVYVRWDCDDYLERRAKLVRAEFTHAIGAHWTQAPFQANQVVFDGRGALAHPP